MKKKLLIIPLLLLTSCNDPMFFEGKKATPEEMQSIIDNIDNNGAFIKPGWYEYNAEINENHSFKGNNDPYIKKSIYNIKFLASNKENYGVLDFEKLIGTKKVTKGLKSENDPYVKSFEYFGNENEMFIISKDEKTNEIRTMGSEEYSFVFNPIFLNFYSKGYKSMYIKENDIHINFDSKIDDTSFKRDLAFSYDENYNLKMGKFKMTIKVDNNEELYTETTVETLIPCEEQIFDIRKDYEEDTKYRFFIFIVS